MIKKSLIAIALLASSFAASAVTGNEVMKDWYSYKQATENPNLPVAVGAGYYIGFITGVSGILPTKCVPKNVTYGQVAAVVGQYMEKHPGELDKPFQVIIIRAMQSTWSCI